MIKNARITFMMVLTIAILAACKKSNDTPANSVTGFWMGKYGGITGYPSIGYNFLFRKDGTVRVYTGNDTSGGSKAEGTYAVLGSTITTKYTYLVGASTYSASASVNNKYSFMEGTWGTGTSTTDGGRFFIVRQ